MRRRTTGDDPFERALITHRAPPTLLERALRAERRRARRPRGPVALLVAAAFLCGVGGSVLASRLLGGDGGGAAMSATYVDGSGVAGGLGVGERAPVAVRLVHHAPGAAQVAVAGTWNGWDPTRGVMKARGDGVFEIVLALPPGEHEYMFVIDGTQWVTDPTALHTRDDGFGQKNAVLSL